MHYAHVVGSMLRPPELIEARSRLLSGSLDQGAYAAVERAAVRDALALQTRAGIGEPTDGELGRFFFGSPLCEDVEGIGLGRGWSMEWHNPDGEIDEVASLIVIQDRLGAANDTVVRAFDAARENYDGPLKVTLPGPYVLSHLWQPGRSHLIYPDPFDLFVDGVQLLRGIIAKLVDRGCRSIQIDQPELALLGCEHQYAARFAERSGLPADAMLGAAPELLNEIVRGFDEVSFGLHICHGNHIGRWFAWGDYELLARKVLCQLSGYDRFLLEFGVERAGSYAPLALLPGTQQVVLGLVSTTNRAVEHPKAVRQQVLEAAQWYDLGQLGVTTTCGFACVMHGNGLAPAEQAAKLRTVGVVARDLWG